jgi:signal transduction histidine kinase
MNENCSAGSDVSTPRSTISVKFIKKFGILTLLLLGYSILKNSNFELVEHFIRDSFQYLNSTNEVDNSFVTLTMNLNVAGSSSPHPVDDIKKVVNKVQEANPKNVIVMMEPLDFVTDKESKEELYRYFVNQKNLFLNKFDARAELSSFENDELFRNFDRFIHFYKSTDPQDKVNRRALISLSATGDVELFNDLVKLGYTPKPPSFFRYSFDYWNSKQVYLKNYPLGTFGNYQTKDLFEGHIESNVFNGKTVIIGTNDEFSRLLTRSPFNFFDVRKKLAYQKNWIPLQDTLANNLSLLTTGNYIKLIQNFDDLMITTAFLALILLIPINFYSLVFIFLSAIPLLYFASVIIYFFWDFYVDVSRSIILLAVTQYFGLPLLFLDKYKQEQSNKYHELNEARINALISISEQVAHDLRSPLSTVNLLISKAQFENEGNRGLIKNAIERIDVIIDEILSAGKITKNPLSICKIELLDFVTSIIREKSIHSPKIQFEINIDPKVCVMADKLALSRVLNNIIDNSLSAFNERITTNPKISIEGAVARNYYEIYVADNGPGISEEIVTLLGEKRVSSKTRKNGFGIGFLLSKKLVIEMGGTLRIKETSSSGTTVLISLPT